MRGHGGRGRRRGGHTASDLVGTDGIPGRRRLSGSDLQLLLLRLLAERSAHGYELIQTIQERSGGFYTPSPGMVYPALMYLDEIGRAVVKPDGNRKSYALSDAGRSYLEENREQAELMLNALVRIGGRMPEVREAFAGLDSADPEAAQELHRARHALRHALERKRGSSPDEARRIARILDGAATEILSV